MRTTPQYLAAEYRASGAWSEQRIGDLYASFMDEAKVNALGRQPLDPELARIDALANKTDLARHMGRMNMLNMT